MQVYIFEAVLLKRAEESAADIKLVNWVFWRSGEYQ